ncbi:lasso peptide biosynthesis B2 protein [Streptomyces sp. XM4193]|uniref:lasso peptide biosynthesis B2 protein n=1 Tax=Streptomyces sp. XM4193 TaxID=2929782 RepID=UPI001FFBA038|nr:lasso peptide biosynthesis B2 protein [Streptomyces sp. XM4193]MCK1794769.1 lasso peptide biosynthesis B2 protein [Streptomyces sp. XM4193]
MSMQVSLQTTGRVPWTRRPAALLAVAAARVLIRLRPKRLRRVLSALARGARPADAQRALAARDAVVAVSTRCAGQGCLQRAVATALLCRSAGTWPDWCTGVRARPFQAHAWVEVDGRAVGEPEDIGFYRTVMSVRATARQPVEANRGADS